VEVASEVEDDSAEDVVEIQPAPEHFPGVTQEETGLDPNVA
jgi:hypothetical protein